MNLNYIVLIEKYKVIKKLRGISALYKFSHKCSDWSVFLFKTRRRPNLCVSRRSIWRFLFAWRSAFLSGYFLFSQSLSIVAWFAALSLFGTANGEEVQCDGPEATLHGPPAPPATLPLPNHALSQVPRERAEDRRVRRNSDRWQESLLHPQVYRWFTYCSELIQGVPNE